VALLVVDRDRVVAIPLDPVAAQVVARVKAAMPAVPVVGHVPVADPVAVRVLVVAPAALVVPVVPDLEVAPVASVAHRGVPAGGVAVATRKSCNRNT
jgi:hypothetical protein